MKSCKYLNALRQSFNDCNDLQPLARYPKEESVSLDTLPMSSARKFEQISAMIFKEESVNFLQEIKSIQHIKGPKATQNQGTLKEFRCT